MNSRRSSSQRTRKWSSTGATSTTEDAVSYHSMPVQHPIRDPRIPPTELRAQKDQGFAYFLKKHASPPHKRVTAGGRIVPMEPRPAPPAFELSSSRLNIPKSSEDSPTYGNDTYIGPSVTAENLHKAHAYATQSNAYMQVNAQDMSRASSHLNSGKRVTGLEVTPQEPTSLMPPFPVNTDPMVAAPITAPTYTMTSMGVTTSHDCGMEASQAVYNYASHGFPPAMPSPPYGPYMTHDWSHQHFFPQQEMLTYQVSAQSSLAYWTQYFDELDRQLKTLDRQRATTNLTQAFADQRRYIVQQRADTKAIINKLQDFLGMSEKVVQASHAVFNVNAPSYVPSIHQAPKPTRPTRVLRNTEATSLTATDADEKPQLPGAKRPIPIVPPPVASTHSPMAMSVATSVGHNEVDDWGIKVGKAPPELERQQNQMLECLVESISSSSSRASSKVNLPLPQKSFSENDASARGTEHDDTSDDEEVRTLYKAGRAPPHIEAAYELQLDAMRQSKGVVTMLCLPDGSSMDVEGQDLQRPPTSGMSEFEREYWSRKPSINKMSLPSDSSGSVCHTESAQASTSSARISTNEIKQTQKENVTVAPVIHRKAATDAFLAQFNENMVDALPSPQDDTRSLVELGLAQNDRNRQILHDMYGTSENARVANTKTVSNTYKQDAEYSLGQYIHQGDIRTRRNEPSGEENMPAESMYNKGYSSVSIQNVHALAHLPQSLDGSSEDKKGALALLGLAKKTKSPRLLQRSGANGHTWFGPFRRDATSSEPVSPVRSIYGART